MIAQSATLGVQVSGHCQESESICTRTAAPEGVGYRVRGSESDEASPTAVELSNEPVLTEIEYVAEVGARFMAS
jgi:hypothetical protein